MADLMQYTDTILHWDVNFLRAMQDWELESLSNFMDMIYGASVKGSGQHKLCWKPEKNKGFMVRGYYMVLLDNGVQSFPWKGIWTSKIPSRVTFFIWSAALEKILTIDNLWKKNVWLLDWGYMCKC